LAAAPPVEITRLLLAWGQGDTGALEQLVPVVYSELHRLARCHMRGERSSHTLQTTALVNEAYLRLVDARRVRWRDRAHFYAMASRLMRRILVDAARTRRAKKRGAGAVRVSIDGALALAVDDTIDLPALDEALQALSALDDRKGQVVELRFFGGLTLAETAAVLQVSEDTVQRDWNFARTWLKRRLSADAATS
jgi:RNA polymerase sigma factor (TIGR02999 family)